MSNVTFIAYTLRICMDLQVLQVCYSSHMEAGSAVCYFYYSILYSSF